MVVPGYSYTRDIACMMCIAEGEKSRRNSDLWDIEQKEKTHIVSVVRKFYFDYFSYKFYYFLLLVGKQSCANWLLQLIINETIDELHSG